MRISEFVSMIDHTLLKPEATPDQVDRLCDEAIEFGFRTVFVNPMFVGRAAKRLRNADTVVGSVAGFPLGASRRETVVDEARRAIDAGAHEVDMVAWVGGLVSADKSAVVDTIQEVACAAHGSGSGRILKVILEAGVLTDEQIIFGCRCAAEGEADFVKTSTGFHPAGGAHAEHVELMHRHAAPLKVKASGGIRSLATAMAMIEAGASRLGTSAGLAILGEFERRGDSDESALAV